MRQENIKIIKEKIDEDELKTKIKDIVERLINF